jgi:hypothetical protein
MAETMKITNILLPFAAAALTTSCLGDLDTLPLNESDSTSETAYGNEEKNYLAGLTKIYWNFANTSDLAVDDGGASELVRAFWSLQEISADAVKCAWGDAWVSAINTNSWSDADNAATYGVYARTLQGIAYVNEFLRQTAPDKLSERGVSAELAAKIDGFRDEARFARAYFYWMALDVFGNVPFTTEDSPIGGGFTPSQAPRADVFRFCVDELTYLGSSESAMPAPRSNYPRADKGSVAGLLARMYLNAEVYTGTAMWAEAKAACEAIFAMGYSLAPTHAELFRGDNGENPDATKEILFAVAYDAESTQSYGGTSYMLFPTMVADEVDDKAAIGINAGWAGNRVPYEYVNRYFGVKSADYATGAYTLSTTDLRGDFFNIKGRTESMNDALNIFLNGWSFHKFNNVPHDKTVEEYRATAATKAYSDIDFPLIRLGEIYLIYAEACLELGQAAQATEKLRELSARAEATFPGTLNEEYLIAERARELMWEGHRRTDLIRWGKYTDASFMWTFKGGTFTGQNFPKHMEIFAIPPTELSSNLNLVQNPGYGRGGSVN